MYRSSSKRSGEWGIVLRPIKLSMQWKMMLLNGLVIGIVVWLTGVAVTEYACYLVIESPDSGTILGPVFRDTLEGYLWKMALAAVLAGSLTHFFLMRTILRPLNRLASSTRQMTAGSYPDPVPVPASSDEVSQLTRDFNHLVQVLRHNERSRKHMLTNISHDLRTPLSNLTGYLEGLKNGVIEGDPALYQSLHEEALRLNHLIEQFHQLSVWETKPPLSLRAEPVDMQELLHSSRRRFEWKGERKGISLSMRAEPGRVTADPQGCESMIDNLLQNALEYNTGTWISIRGSVTEGGFYRVKVSNPGEPLADAERDQLFDRFYRGDESRNRGSGGSGLGLSIVREIAGRHGGTSGVEIDREVYTFWFTLPLVSAAGT